MAQERPFSEVDFELVFEAGPNALVLVDERGVIALVNAQVEKLFGCCREELIGKPVEALFPERLRERLPEFRRGFHPSPQTRPTGAGRDLHARRRDGSEFPVEISLTPIKTQGGMFILGAIMDLTERKKAEERFRRVVESAPSAMVMVDAAGKVVLVNSQMERLFGYRREEMIGQSVDMLVPERFRARYPGFREAFFRDPRARPMGAGRDLSARRKDGTEFPVEIGLNPIETEEGTFVLSAVVDLTERKLAEERFRMVVESSPSGMVVVDQQGVIVLVNSQAERLFGYRREEMIGQLVDMLVPERFRAQHPQFRESFFTDPRSRPMGAGRDLYGRRKDGTEFPVEIGLNPVETERGLLVLSAIVDITERKKADEALRDADRRKDEFLAMLAHELRNPLAPILNAVQILKFKGPSDPFLNDCRDMIERQVKLMKRLLDDLLDVSRITRGKIQLRMEPTDLPQTIVQAVEATQPLLESKRHQVVLRLPRFPVVVLGDQGRLVQIFTNLLNNAAKYTDAQGRLEVILESNQTHAQVRFKDNGIGMTADMLTRAFELFAQAEQTLDRSQGGLGIGLTLVRSLVEMHGGTVRAFSEGTGRGSEFLVELPVVTHSPAPPTGGKQEPAAEKGAARKVLVVEDIDDVAQALAILLELLGHRVEVARDGPAALTLASTFCPDVVFLDIGLPGMDGYQVARRLKDTAGLERTVLVAMTGYGQEEDRRRCREAGFDHHLVKPAEVRAIQDVLRELA